MGKLAVCSRALFNGIPSNLWFTKSLGFIYMKIVVHIPCQNFSSFAGQGNYHIMVHNSMGKLMGKHALYSKNFLGSFKQGINYSVE